jgi:hypothetical protein
MRRCFAEWIIGMDQFQKTSLIQQVAHAETSEKGTAEKGTI